jgi:epoxyqueuosine reductase
MKACPTGAIVEPYVVDARRCISYLTIELPRTGQAIPTEFHHPIANRIFGCDDCLEACPYNVNAIETDVREFQPSPVALAPPLSELAALPEREFDRVFHTSPVRRAKYGGFLRTLGIALANQCGDTPTRMAEMHRHDLTN